MRIGYHISISDGFSKSAQFCKIEKLSAVQIFAGSTRTYFPSKHSPADLADFKNLNIPKFVHSNYLINPASDKPVLPKAIADNLKFCDEIGADGLVIHMGSCKDKNLGMKLTLMNITEAYKKSNSTSKILIETTAEGGNYLKFNDIIDFIEKHGNELNTFMCIDSAHLFAAGYTLEQIIEIIEKYKDIIGLVHLNNPSPNVELGKHKDQHDISLFSNDGKFTKTQIDNLISICLLFNKPMILETGEMKNDHKFILENYSYI